MKTNKIVVKSKAGLPVIVAIHSARKNVVSREFPSIDQALAFIQCKEFHAVPAWVNGGRTIISAWV